MLRIVCAVALASLGCGDDDAACVRDEDCGAFQRCIERACRPLPRSDASVRRDGGSRDGGPRDGGRPSDDDAGVDAGRAADCMSADDCPVGYACIDGMCTCGAPGSPCCAVGPACEKGAACDGFGNCERCGEIGSPCCASRCASPDAVCDPAADVCASCGGADERCCELSVCDAMFACVSGFCRAGCGDEGEPCCAPRRCAPGLMCNLLGQCAM